MYFRLSLVLAVMAALALLTFIRPARAEPEEIHYAPIENLERIDLALIGAARERIDLAAFDLTDRPVIDALISARRRGVALRIVLDPHENHAYERLSEIDGLIRLKAPGPFMHLKAYLIDRRVLRTGSANLTASGLKQQDNDLLVLRQPAAATAFAARFERIWAAARPLPRAAPAPPAAARSGCAIKGNINARGERLYHLPGGRGYDRVVIDTVRGERWFCSEREAVAAGWRRAGGR
ncbi:MAG TPA: phospholipase D-like domain-containing protein [Methylocystis sp.]|nr:phospholipase D-like domain-containing protein [Methylocystis sp.]